MTIRTCITRRSQAFLRLSSAPGTGGEKDILKMQMLYPRGVFGEVVNYLKEYYVKGYGAVIYYEEVNVPM